jgi:hypothetical protein
MQSRWRRSTSADYFGRLGIGSNKLREQTHMQEMTDVLSWHMEVALHVVSTGLPCFNNSTIMERWK